MSDKQSQTPGVIGGMGPEATVDLMQRIIRNTPASGDSDHIRCIVDNNPKIPSRIKAIFEGTGESPAPVMQDMARRLEAWGADFLAIPCNTAHYYYPDVQKAVSIPVLNMIELTVAAAAKAVPGLRRAGILATPATRMTKLYDAPLAAQGVEAVYPTPEGEARVLDIIKAVKAGDTGPEARQRLGAEVAAMKELGAEAVFLACTELGVIEEAGYALPTVNAAEVLAKAIVDRAKQE